jgi:hypothetical protein
MALLDTIVSAKVGAAERKADVRGALGIFVVPALVSAMIPLLFKNANDLEDAKKAATTATELLGGLVVAICGKGQDDSF